MLLEHLQFREQLLSATKTLSVAARKTIAEAQKARWAKWKLKHAKKAA
jgi:hypothetical protein